MSALGLNDHHQEHIVQYLRFARYQRGQRLKSVLGCFDDIRDSHVKDEANFTIDEVEDMLADLEENIRTEVEAEFINAAHTNILLLRQLFQQAEKWHLRLSADISELENKALLDAIREFEEREFSGARDDARPHLAPVNDTGGTELLRQEIQRLEGRIRQLEERLEDSEIAGERLKTEKVELLKRMAQGTKGGDRAVRDLEEELAKLRDDRRSLRSQAAAEASASPEDLEDELTRIRSLLGLAEQELELKVSQTTPFRNLKQMLQKKNEQIKDLRRRLAQFEDDDD